MSNFSSCNVQSDSGRTFYEVSLVMIQSKLVSKATKKDNDQSDSKRTFYEVSLVMIQSKLVNKATKNLLMIIIGLVSRQHIYLAHTALKYKSEIR